MRLAEVAPREGDADGRDPADWRTLLAILKKRCFDEGRFGIVCDSANAKLRETRKGVILAVAKAFPACAWAREVASEGLWGALPLAGPGRRVAARRRIAQPPRAIALGELPSAAIE